MKNHIATSIFAVFIGIITAISFPIDQLFVLSMIGFAVAIISYITAMFTKYVEGDYKRVKAELGLIVTSRFYIPIFIYSATLFFFFYYSFSLFLSNK